MNQSKPQPETLPPLSRAVFHILLALSAGEKHGYAIMQEIAFLTDDAVRIGPATLYRSIKQMLEDGLLVESAERPDPALDDKRRRYYCLTEYGESVAAAEARRLATLVEEARARRLLDAPATE